MTQGEIILKLIKDVTEIELEIGDEFYINYSFLDVNYNLLKVTQEGLVYVEDGQDCNISLHGFIDEIKAIKVKPKFPKDDTKYYCIAKDNHIYDWVFSKYITFDVLNFKTGNFFLTREEAEQNKEKFMKILNNPEKVGI